MDDSTVNHTTRVDGLDSDERYPPASALLVSGRELEMLRHRAALTSRTDPE